MSCRSGSSIPPLGWGLSRLSYCYRMSIPAPDNGTHMNLHRNLAPHLRRHDTRTRQDLDEYGRMLVILRRQRSASLPRIQGVTGVTPGSKTRIARSAGAMSGSSTRTPRSARVTPGSKTRSHTSAGYMGQRGHVINPSIVGGLSPDHVDGDVSIHRNTPSASLTRAKPLYTASEVTDIVSMVTRETVGKNNVMTSGEKTRPVSQCRAGDTPSRHDRENEDKKEGKKVDEESTEDDTPLKKQKKERLYTRDEIRFIILQRLYEKHSLLPRREGSAPASMGHLRLADRGLRSQVYRCPVTPCRTPTKIKWAPDTTLTPRTLPITRPGSEGGP